MTQSIPPTPLPPDGWNPLQVSSMPHLERLLARARGLDGASEAERAWALRQVGWMREDILGEKQTLSRIHATGTLVFWSLLFGKHLTRGRRDRYWHAMLLSNGAITLGVYARIMVCNWLLRRTWGSGNEALPAPPPVA